MSDTSQGTPSGSGEKKGQFSVTVDPAALEQLINGHPSGSEDDKQAAKSGSSTHLLTIDVSGLTWAEVHSVLGSSDFLTGAKLTITPLQKTNDLQGDVHIDLLKQTWPSVGPVILQTGLSGDLEYSEHGGGSGKLDLTQDVKLSDATLELEVTTGTNGEVSGSVAFKYSF